RPDGAQLISIAIGGKVLCSWHAPRDQWGSDRPDERQVGARPQAKVTVIVPIYGDLNATRSCLDSLVRPLGSGYRAILVNDSTPDPRIASLIDKLKTKRNFRVLVNESNLGFAASVNRALAHAAHGDIILLNADTIVPKGFIARLEAAARSSSDIGTVTPLSNN